MVVTMDRRFADIRRYPPGTHPGFLVIHSDDQSPPFIVRILSAFLDTYRLEEMAGCIVIVEPGAVRIRKPDDPTLRGGRWVDVPL